MSKLNGLSWRAITLNQAHWVGNAAAVAGGYIAVNGPRLLRVSAEDRQRDEAEWSRIAAEYGTAAVSALREKIDSLTPIQGGDYAAVATGEYASESEYLVLAVPADGPLHDIGWSIPQTLIRELLPMLESGGYATQQG